MGIFNKLLGGTDSAFSPEEAVLAVLFLVVAADGEISEEEKDLFIATSNRMKLLQKQPPAEFNATIEKIRRSLDKHGFDSVLAKAATAVPVELRDTVFALSADLIFADGSVGEDETMFLEAVQSALQISDELAIKIVEVLQIKNKG